MASVYHPLYIVAAERDPQHSLVLSPENLSWRAMPTVVLGDTMQLHIHLLNEDGTAHDAAANSNYLLTAAIGNYTVGMVAYSANFYPSASVWTGSIDLNRVGVAQLLNSASYVEALFEVQLQSLVEASGSTQTILQCPIRVNNQLLDNGFLNSGSLIDYLNQNESDQRYVLRSELSASGGWTAVANSISYTDRNVGINTNNPQADLHVVGDVIISNTLSASYITASRLHGTASYADNAAGWNRTGSTTYTTQSIGIGLSNPKTGFDADLMVRTPNTVVRFDSTSGSTQVFVGADTTSSNAHIDLYHGSSNQGGSLYSQYPNLWVMSKATNTGSLIFSTNSASFDRQRMVIKNDGKVGIGTDSPVKDLHIFGEVSASNYYGTFIGTASYTDNQISASYATSASYARSASYVGVVDTASYASSANHATTSTTASFALFAVSASYITTGSFTLVQQSSSSFASSSISSSYSLNAETASAARYGIAGFDARGGLTASLGVRTPYLYNTNGTTNITVGTSGTTFNKSIQLGSNQIQWSAIPNLYLAPVGYPTTGYGWLELRQGAWTHSYDEFRGLKVYGDISADTITGSLHGTASVAIMAYTTSYVTQSTVQMVSSSYASSSLSSSYSLTSLTASYAHSASNVIVFDTSASAEYALVFTTAAQGTAQRIYVDSLGGISYDPGTSTLTVLNVIGTATNALSASYWNSSSIATALNNKQATIGTGSTLPITASYASLSATASYVNIAQSALSATTASSAVSASRAHSANTANTATSSLSASVLNSLGTYVWDNSTSASQYALGVTNAFVSAITGSFPNYGSVLTVRSYTGGGGSMQIFAPYGPSYGGNSLRFRTSNYEALTANPPWKEWKVILDSETITTASVASASVATSASVARSASVVDINTNAAEGTYNLLFGGTGNGSRIYADSLGGIQYDTSTSTLTVANINGTITNASSASYVALAVSASRAVSAATANSASYAVSASSLSGIYYTSSVYTYTTISVDKDIIGIGTGSFVAATFDYCATNTVTGSNLIRGKIEAAWIAGTVTYTNTGINEIGTNTSMSMAVVLSGNQALLRVNSPIQPWTIKVSAKAF